jgi:glycosyltransferase involved in cell wall biosynthesis
MKNSLIPVPVMIHPNLSMISTSPSDFFLRMNQYASSISSQINKRGFKLTLLIGLHSADLPHNMSGNYPCLRVIRVSNPTLNFRTFAKKCMIVLAKFEMNPTILVAGDNSVGLMSCFYARSIIDSKIPIQISVHGSFFGLADNVISYSKSRIRIGLLRVFLPHVESVRVVSAQVRQEMIEKFRADPRRIFIAPIPFRTYPEFQDRDFQSATIGVIGRFHVERNLDEILEITEFALKNSRVSNVIFVGSGPLKKKVQNWKSRSASSEKISLLGPLPHNDVLDRLSKIDILLSAARSEGYGLAIRESLLSGAIVVARRNEGTEQIKEAFKSGIYLYDTVSEANHVITKLVAGVEKPIPCVEGRRIQEIIDDEALKKICESWTAI